jgi:hypothetical protein
MTENILVLLHSAPDLPCRESPHLFWSENPTELMDAKVLCRGCRLRTECLIGAMQRGEPGGVWGGELLFRGAVVTTANPNLVAQHLLVLLAEQSAPDGTFGAWNTAKLRQRLGTRFRQRYPDKGITAARKILLSAGLVTRVVEGNDSVRLTDAGREAAGGASAPLVDASADVPARIPA